VAITPIEGRCRACQNELLLAEVAELGTGECPRCLRPLSPDWTPLLLEESRQADRLQERLVGSLHRLVNLPGNLELFPNSVLRNLFEEVGWDKVLAAEPDVLRGQVELVRDEVEAWAELTPEDGRRRADSIGRALQSLAGRLRATAEARRDEELAGRVPATEAAEEAREAAGRLDVTARELVAGRADPAEVHRQLDAAEAAIPQGTSAHDAT
jgi:hypothetical protein